MLIDRRRVRIQRKRQPDVDGAAREERGIRRLDASCDDTGNRDGALVERDGTVHDVGRPAEAVLPEALADDRGRRAGARVVALIGLREHASDDWPGPEQIKDFPAHESRQRTLGG
jgi:hypothetical protein